MRETRILEFKETITSTFLKTVSAFSNYDGGTIFFGVDDDGNVKGLPDVKQACLSPVPKNILTLPFRGDDRILLVKIIQGGFLYERTMYSSEKSHKIIFGKKDNTGPFFRST